MTRRVNSIKNKYFCLNCLDHNLLIECACGCGSVLTKRKWKKIRSFIKGHDKREKGHYNWKGGLSIDEFGYTTIIRRHHKYAYKNGRIRLHRYRMELMLGRYLDPNEHIHHIDKNPNNNEEDNLMLFSTQAEHNIYEQTKDMSGRFCNICGGKTRLIKYKNGKIYENWYGNEVDGWKCFNCYRKLKKILGITSV